MQPTVAIITIGDEILIGQIVDTNSAFIGSVAADNGIKVTEIHSIQDSKDAICRTISETMERVDIVIVTGGLGPTKDDITKKAIAELFSVGLYRDIATYNHVQSMLSSRGVEFNELNQAQADIPEGFSALSNPVGTAPGLFYNGTRGTLFCLPGVPFEMKRLFTDEVIPRISKIYPLQEIVRKTVIVYGIAESELAVRISQWENSLIDNGLSLAYLPNPAGIRLRVSHRGGNAISTSQAEEEITERLQALEELLPDNYLGLEPISVISEVARLLSASGKTLSTAESCSGGSIAKKCTSLSGSSTWFSGGVVAYSNESKVNILGVDSLSIESVGAVSSEVAAQMALGALERFSSDYSIATTGIAGPTGATDSKSLGDVHIAIASRQRGIEQLYFRNFGQPREVFVERLTAAALNYLRLLLIKSK